MVCPYLPLRHPCGGKGGGNKRKNNVLQSVFFSWFAHTCLYVTHVTKKPRFTKRGFFVVCQYLPLCHPCGGKGGGNKRKNHVLQSVFFSGFAHTCLYVTHVRGKGGGNKRKNHVIQSVFFSWFAHILASTSPMWGAREEVTNEKTTFCKVCFFRGFKALRKGPSKER